MARNLAQTKNCVLRINTNVVIMKKILLFTTLLFTSLGFSQVGSIKAEEYVAEFEKKKSIDDVSDYD